MFKPNRGWRLLALALLTCSILLLVAQTQARRNTIFDQFDLLVDIHHQLVKEYVEEPDQRKMTEAAVRAMVESVDDPYTVYLTPEEVEPFDKVIRGSFYGIGAEVDIHDNRLRIISPLEESPAWKAGVLAGDIVYEIDGKSTEGMSIGDAIKLLQGAEGTKVVIKVHHPSGEEALLTITRAQINVQTVKGVRRGADQHWDFMLDHAHGIGYIRITQFTEATANDVKAALEQLKARHFEGLILDLRFNPGGLLDSAVQISDMFLPGGRRIVSVKGRAVPERVTMSTDTHEIDPVPMVVLANEGSASAAEIVTGALSDNDRACFVGTRTFGKGSVQQVRTLDNGHGALKITNAYYYLPNGRNIHRRKDKDVWGVDPTEGCYVPMTPEQTQSMLRVRRDDDILRGPATQPDSAPVTPESVVKDLADPQLAAGLKAVLGKLADDKWPTVGLPNAQALAMEAKRDGLVRTREALEDRLASVQKELAKIDHPTTQPGSLNVALENGNPGAGATTQPVAHP